jgi:Smg protein
MFEVLAYVYDNYWSGPQCPGLSTLHRKLNAVGFDAEEILNALVWLEELQSAAQAPIEQRSCPPTELDNIACTTSLQSIRVLSPIEQQKIGTQAWGLLTYLVSIGSMPWDRLELIIDRAMAAPGACLAMDDFKLIVLMVFWSLNDVPDPLVTDSLLGTGAVQPAH